METFFHNLRKKKVVSDFPYIYIYIYIVWSEKKRSQKERKNIWTTVLTAITLLWKNFDLFFFAMLLLFTEMFGHLYNWSLHIILGGLKSLL